MHISMPRTRHAALAITLMLSAPILSHAAFLTIETRQAARQCGAWDVVVRGGLNPMWSAMSNLLAASASELRAKPGLQPT